MKDGYIHIYTGNGKGKTTAALGLILRACGQNLKAGYFSFHKDFSKWKNGEMKILQKLNVVIKNYAKPFPMKLSLNEKEKLRIVCIDALEDIKKTWTNNKFDILVIDELNVTIAEGLLKEDEVLDFIRSKPKSLELIITGRNAKNKIIKEANLVTEMKERKHYFKEGIFARKGIEY